MPKPYSACAALALVRAGKTINKTANELRMSAAALPDWDSVISYLTQR